MRGPPGPPTPPRPRNADDSVETTTPDPDPRKTPRAPPPNVRALRFLDDEPTVARERDRDPDRTLVKGESDGPPSSGSRDLFARPDERPPLDPATLPITVSSRPAAQFVSRVPIAPPPRPAAAPRDLFDVDATVPPADEVPPPRAVAAPPPPVAAPPPPAAAPPPPPAVAPPPVAVAPPPVVVAPPPSTPLAPLAFASPDDEPAETSVFGQVSLLPCTLRALLNGLKSHPDPRVVEAVAINVAGCVRDLHRGAVVLGERLVPENFYCHTDQRVEYREAAPPAPELADLYRAPELFRAKPATAQTDVFATAAIVYELLVGRSLKPMFLPTVMQSGRTDSWFSDPGPSMHDTYKIALSKALAERPTQRHGDMNLFADELVRAWRLTHNPEARIAEVEDTESPWRNAAVPIAVVAAFVLVLLALIFFPVDRLTQPAVAPVRPDLSQ